MLLDGLFLAIECSLKYLLENTGIYWLMDVGYSWRDNSHKVYWFTVKGNWAFCDFFQNAVDVLWITHSKIAKVLSF